MHSNCVVTLPNYLKEGRRVGSVDPKLLVKVKVVGKAGRGRRGVKPGPI